MVWEDGRGNPASYPTSSIPASYDPTDALVCHARCGVRRDPDHQADNVGAERDEHGRQRGDVQEQVHCQVLGAAEAQHVLGEHEMPGTANGQEFREPLNQAEYGGVDVCHAGWFQACLGLGGDTGLNHKGRRV